jgi:hypothetical protein
MKVALFLPDLGGGGAERVFALLARGLVAQGIDAQIVLVKAQGPHLEAVRSNVPVMTLECPRHGTVCSGCYGTCGALGPISSLRRWTTPASSLSGRVGWRVCRLGWSSPIT